MNLLPDLSNWVPKPVVKIKTPTFKGYAIQQIDKNFHVIRTFYSFSEIPETFGLTLTALKRQLKVKKYYNKGGYYWNIIKYLYGKVNRHTGQLVTIYESSKQAMSENRIQSYASLEKSCNEYGRRCGGFFWIKGKTIAEIIAQYNSLK